MDGRNHKSFKHPRWNLRGFSDAAALHAISDGFQTASVPLVMFLSFGLQYIFIH